MGVGRTKLKIVEASEWEALRKKAGELERLQAKVRELESDLQSSNEKLVLEGLRNRQERLVSDVDFLQDIKSDLREEILAAKRIRAE